MVRNIVCFLGVYDIKNSLSFQDQLLVRLSSRGLLILTLTAGDGRLNAFVGEGLLDGRWHTLAVRY